MEYKIYKITNLLNNKCYVGKTRRTLDIRMKEHIACRGECIAIIGAIKKYGKENFIIELLDTCSSWEESKIQETKYILKLNTLVPNGYNLNLECPSGAIFHEDVKKKMSKNLQGNQYTKRNNNYIGVRKSHNLYEVRIKKNKICYRKSFKNGIEAAEAYDKIVLYLYGTTSKLNFIDNLKQYLNENLSLFFENFTKPLLYSSNYRGVCWHKCSAKWCAYIVLNKKSKYIGLFNSEQEAALAYNNKAKELFGDKAKLNFLNK